MQPGAPDIFLDFCQARVFSYLPWLAGHCDGQSSDDAAMKRWLRPAAESALRPPEKSNVPGRRGIGANDSDASRNLQNKKAPGYVSITERTRHLLRLLQLRLQASDEHQI